MCGFLGEGSASQYLWDGGGDGIPFGFGSDIDLFL